MDGQAQVMLRKAMEDRVVLNYESLPDTIFGFHAQQAFEKLFKALLAWRNIPYERTHDLAMLLKQLRGGGVGPLPLPYQVRLLQPFAVWLRYDDGDPIPVEERQEIRDAIDVLIAYVAGLVPPPAASNP